MSAPRWCRWLLARLAADERVADVVGDLEEAHRMRVVHRGRPLAQLFTTVETLDMAWALLRERRRARAPLFALSRLDLKLGLRMLRKHPGITALSTLAVAFGIFVGASAFELTSQLIFPKLPLPDGDRIVGIRLFDASLSRTEGRALHDLAIWRTELTTVADLGAYREVHRNVITPDGRAEPMTVAEIEAEGFRVAGVAPLLGRPLLDEDEGSGAAPVVVIGHDVWTVMFEGDPEVIGTTVRLDGEPTTVVGVMPEGFRFPIAHSLWIPAHMRDGSFAPREGPGVRVFGRLAAGASLAQARSELAVVGNAVAAAFPATHEHLRPQVMRWPRAVMAVSIFGVPGSLLSLVIPAIGFVSNLPLVLFLVLVCGNVALLMFARAVSRESELVVRSALGASRRRIAAQLFAEALVLASIAAVIGLGFARYGLGWALRIIENILLEGNPLPFWFGPSLSPTTLFYSALLTFVAALVAGVLPGFKATRGLSSQLQRRSAGGGGFRFGGVWTVVLVSQIAVTMIFPLLIFVTRAQSERELDEDLDLAGAQYVAAQLRMNPPAPRTSEDATEGEADAWMRTRFAPTLQELGRRLAGSLGVEAVTFTERLPRQYHPWRQVEVDGPMAEPPDERGHRLGSSAVALNYFDVIGARIVSGRGFRPADVSGGPPVVVVNESFVERALGGRNAIGQRIRYLASEEYRDPEQDPGPWHEIVGVVEDRGTRSGYGPQGMYHPVAVGGLHPIHVILHASGDPRVLAPTLQTVATSVDPSLRLENVITLDMVTLGQREFFAFWTTVLVIVSGLALLLSLGGIFAVMSYTVARRTREIGIRVALGSGRARVLATVFRRPLVQLALGVLSGGFLLTTTAVVAEATWPDFGTLLFVSLYMAGTAVVCLLGCIVPTTRALGVQPSEALRAE